MSWYRYLHLKTFMEFSTFSIFGLDTKTVKIGVEVGPVDWSLQSGSQRDCRGLGSPCGGGWKWIEGFRPSAICCWFLWHFCCNNDGIAPLLLGTQVVWGWICQNSVYGRVNMGDSTCRYTGRTCELEKNNLYCFKTAGGWSHTITATVGRMYHQFCRYCLTSGKYATHHLLPRSENPLTYFWDGCTHPIHWNNHAMKCNVQVQDFRLNF